MDGRATRRRRLVDAGLVAGLGALFLASSPPDDVVGGALAAAVVVPLWWRRRRPLLVAAVVTLAYSAWALLGYPTHPLGSVPAAVAIYSLAGSTASWRAKVVGLVLLVAAFATVAIGLMDMEPFEGVFFITVFVGAWAVGTALASRDRYAAELEARTHELEAARSELADKARAEERARLARELHDIVSHSLGLITLRAGVGAHVADRDPAGSAEALRVIERTGRATLEELRRLLGMLRDGDPGGARDPQPGLDDLEPLVQRMAEAGVDTRLTIRGDRRPLPQLVESSVYRIVQEALTNVAKHAPRAGADVTVVLDGDAVEVEVVNDAPPGTRRRRGGLGLDGMAERVALLGGTFDAGPTDAGWRVRARLPEGTA